MAPPSDPWTTTGQKIHRALETEAEADYAALTHDEAETVGICESQRHRLVAEWIMPSGPNAEHHKERRLGMTRLGNVVDVTAETTAELIVTGMADHIVVDAAHRRGIIADYKALPGQVNPARSNAQLRGLAVLAAGRWNLLTVRVAIIQPLCGPPTVADYTETTLEEAGVWLEFVCEEIYNPTQKPAAGEHCRYCPAQLICPAFKAAALAPLEFIQPATLPLGAEKEAVFARVHQFDGHDIAALLSDPRLKMAGLLTAAAKKVATEMLLADPNSVPGFELRDKKGHRKIEDTDAASRVLGPALAGAEGGATAALLRAAKLSPSLLTEELQKASGRKLKRDGTFAKVGYNLTGVDAKEKLTDTLGGLMVQPVKKALARCGDLIGWDEGEEEG